MGATRQTPKGSATGKSSVQRVKGSAQRDAESVSFSHILTNPVQAHQVLTDKVWPLVKAHTIAGTQLVVKVESLEESRSIQRNKEYWGYVLRPISEQAQINGIGATTDGWHDYYRLMFLGYEFTKHRLPGAKRPSVRRQLKSTTKLSERAMRTYLEQVRAHAATTFSVTFPSMDDGPREYIDQATGEITR